jgi:hypothetical protein
MALPSKETIAPGDEFPVVETGITTPEVPAETQHVEVVTGEEIVLPQKVIDENTQEELVTNVAPQQVVVKLPLTGQQMDQALHLKIIYSFRWLAEWAKRVLKIVGGKFTYRMASGR